jgi:AcrR family transcriptional regulator
LRPRGRPVEPVISRNSVVDEALGIVDEEGIAALSMRSIAKRLGVQAPSLYNHFKGREDILDAVALRILEGLQARPLEDEPWQDWFAQAMLGYRRLLLAHPNAVPLMTRAPLAAYISDSTFQHAAEAMQSDGVPPELMLTIAEAAESLVLGWVLFSSNRSSPATPGPGPERKLLNDTNTMDEDERFEYACYALVNGFVMSLLFKGPRSSANSFRRR